MIIGIGTDIIEIDRIERAIKNNKNFINKIFTNFFELHGDRIF
ncbi:MAG: holo-ACP synthase, partial [Bacilli bacterium]